MLCRLISHPTFKKKPPNNKNGTITGGPIDNATVTVGLTHDIK